MAYSSLCQMKTTVEPQRAKSKAFCQAPSHWLEFYEEAVIV